MTTKFYQINGVWNTYQYWHDNYGYTTEPTQSMNFKSSASGTWGTNVNPGYFTSPGGDTIDNWSFWSEGIVGWKDIDELALAGAYPATAIDILLERNGLIANAVYVDDSDELYYLIDGYLSDGWRPWNEVEADGWQVYEGNPPYYMIVNETTGEIVYSISETEENPSMVFSQVGHIEMPDSDMITVYETGVPVESFYFTTNGRNETENTNISHADIPVYLEDGTAPAADTPYDGSSVLAFMDVTGNAKQAQGEGLYINDGVLRLDAPDTDEGEQWAALVESKAEIDIECNFGDAITVPSGYRVKSVKSTDAFAFGHGTDSGSTVTVEYYGEDTYSSDISQTDINTSGTPGMYIFQMNRNEFPIWGYKLIPNANVTSLSDISVNQNGNFVKLSGTSSYANTIATNANSYPGLFKYLNSSGTVVPQFFNVPSSLWKFENGAFSWLGNTSSPADLAYWYYNDAPYAGIVVTLTNEPEPAPTLPTVEITNGLAVVGSSADYCYSRSFVPIYDSSQNRILYDSTKSYVVQIGNGSGTIWGIEFFCASDSSGYLVAWNRTNVTLLVLGASIYSCSSNSAYRVIVSDSSNVKYPAFAYDLSGATYYYVCDGVQTDWTDDLSTIGYSLVTGSEAYLTSLGASETVDTTIGNSSFYLYSSSGASLYGNQSKKYVLIGQFLKDGTNVTNDGMDSRLTTGMNCSAVNVSSSASSLNKLRLAGTLYSYDVFKVTYLEV